MVSMPDQVRPEQIRVIIQMRTTPALAAAAFGAIEAAPALGITEPSGVELDTTYSPVPVPPKPSGEGAESGFGMAASFYHGRAADARRASCGTGGRLVRFLGEGK